MDKKPKPSAKSDKGGKKSMPKASYGKAGMKGGKKDC